MLEEVDVEGFELAEVPATGGAILACFDSTGRTPSLLQQLPADAWTACSSLACAAADIYCFSATQYCLIWKQHAWRLISS
jgi:hypothetical protein